MKQQTRLISTIWSERDNSCAKTINPPIYRGSTVLFDSYRDMVNAGKNQYEGITYGTDRLPTQRQFEEAMRLLEGAVLTRIFPSGIAAIQNALMACTRSGDHILVCDNAYGPGQRFCRKILKKFGIDHTPIPANAGGDIERYLQPNTVLILLESPGSQSFELQDIPAITEIARERDIITMLDNTWATPLFLKPFDIGVDITIHSLTKYISGYSDLLAGSVSTNEKLSPVIDKYYKTMEIYTPAEECYLALRGMHSLEPRLLQHQQSALTVARWLENHPLVDKVLHPALDSHPEHHIWKRDFTGSSGLFSFTFKKDYSEQQLAQFIDALRLFHLGYSWGGYKSLVTAGKLSRATECRYKDKTIIRLNIGLEACSDILEDLEQGLSRLS
ncbi:cystathionine beta-lyase [Desulforhopalus singaporensis]|uniref:Cystathionine beta-lyase n=1 Tax=Desulforhopalus singaporensis TaxID=91360 RepID=A0A1H0TZA1_9BACT|nr:cystathionine beta-lyase [Desulforhopalus singaporensis]SDP59402.1 cystathionine beta-lyase [Desulforhopalus singaporensis]